MKFLKDTQGAISVFLVIILVPCLFISALFVDMGRLYLSQGMAYSSADLALNSVLTKYDADLNEYYGLIASCQDMDEFYDVSEKFFLRTLSSQELEEDEIALLTDVFQSTVRGVIASEDEVHDLLKVEATEDVSISPVEGANLSKSVMLKEQIVEFMKYRGPITMMSELYGIIQNPDGTYKEGVDAVLNADTDEPIIEAKQEFHDAESDFLRDAYNTYSYLYNNYSKNPIENSVLSEMIDRLGTHLNTYRSIHSTMVGCFYNTENVCVFNRPVIGINAHSSTYTKANVCSSSVTDTDSGVTTYYITWTDLNRIKTNLSNKIAALETAIENFHKSVNGISYTTDTHDIQYWAKVDSIIYGRNGGTNHVNNVATKANEMIKAYAQLQVALSCTANGTDFPTDYEMQCNSLLTEASILRANYLDKNSTLTGDRYIALVKNIERISAAEIYNVTPSTKTIDGQSIDSLLTSISNDLLVIRSYCNAYIQIMDKVIDGGTVTRGDTEVTLLSLDKFVELANNYRTKYNDYKDTVENAPTTDLQQEMAEDISNYNAAKYSEVNGEAVEDMEKRLSNIRSQYQAVIDAIDGMKYGGIQMMNITSYATLKAAADTKVNASSIGITKASVSSEANRTWGLLIHPNLTSGQKVVTLSELDSYNLFLKPEMDRVDVPDLYMFFYNAFGIPNDTAVDEQKKEMDNADDAAKKNNSEDVSKDLLNEDAKQIVSDISASTDIEFGFGTGINAMVELFSDLMGGEFDDIRDNAYICSYILSMFSHASYENEGLYDCYDKDHDVLSLNGTNFKEQYALVNTIDAGMWKSESTEDAYNKSLTNKMINATKNAAYRCELEYILYGKGTNKENIDAACADIFTVRLLLNTISGFVNFWSANSTDTNATAITFNRAGETVFCLSCGVVPAAAVKAVLIMVLVACETCNDMSRLACGFPVEIYKKDDTDWLCALVSSLGEGSRISDVLSSLIGNKVRNTGNGFTYGDYIKLFVCMSVWGDDELETPGMSETVMLRVGDLIQTNIRHVTGNTEFKLSNANTHFKLTCKLSVDPLVVDIPLFDEYNSLLKSKTGWMEYEVNAVRGY